MKPSSISLLLVSAGVAGLLAALPAGVAPPMATARAPHSGSGQVAGWSGMSRSATPPLRRAAVAGEPSTPSMTPTPRPVSRGRHAMTTHRRERGRGRHVGRPPHQRSLPLPRRVAHAPGPQRRRRPQRPPRPLSRLFNHAPLLTIYGRAFGVAPVLGRLGMDDDFAGMDWQIQPFARGIKAYDGGKDPTIVAHLIYAMAVPCRPGGNCLFYLDDAGVDVVKTYIKPAAWRRWLVVLDDQLGGSDPVAEVRHIIARGYLRYDNVEVALDPEFRAAPGQATPGIPVGTVTAEEINSAQALLNAYCARFHLAHRKVLIVHQFQQVMIADRQALRSDFPYVDPVIVADGFGTPGLKAHIYSELLGRDASAGVKWRGIKLFPFNPYENAGHGDDPLLTWPQVFGRVPAFDIDGKPYFVRPLPNVIVIA